MARLHMSTKIQKSTLDVSVVCTNVNFLILYPGPNVITPERDKMHLWNILSCIILFNYFQSQNLKKEEKERKQVVPRAIHCPFFVGTIFQIGEWWAVGHFNLKHCNGWQLRVILALHIHLLRAALPETKLKQALPFQNAFTPQWLYIKVVSSGLGKWQKINTELNQRDCKHK